MVRRRAIAKKVNDSTGSSSISAALHPVGSHQLSHVVPFFFHSSINIFLCIITIAITITVLYQVVLPSNICDSYALE